MIAPIFTLLLLACGSSERKIPVKDTTTASKPLSFSGLTPKEKAYFANAIAPLYQSMLVKRGFNGSILMAKNGEVVFEDYRGYINLKTKESIIPTSRFHVASISKTFTAAVILRLLEQGKISLEDGVERYLPGFPYPNIRIKDLLSHRSGLPKYDHFMTPTRSTSYRVKNKRGRWITRYRSVKNNYEMPRLVTNQDVVAFMTRYRPPVESAPNRRYSYCNTNFAVLALVVERITGQAFPKYMRDSVFLPLGMIHSYVFSLKDTASYIPSYKPNGVPYGIERLDCVYGDKNVYTTVRDLLIWDKALYKGTLVSNATMQLAYQPYSNEKKGVRNYGLGWHLIINPPEDPVIYHNGWWHGNNAVFRRLPGDTATVIILGNKFNPSIWQAGKMSAVFTNNADTSSVIVDE